MAGEHQYSTEELTTIVEAFTKDVEPGQALLHVQAGYDRVLYGIDARSSVRHLWSFLQPVATIRFWKTATSTNDGPNTTKDNGTSTVTVDDAIFYASMIGHSIAFTGGSSYVITAVASTTVCTVTGDASAEADAAVVTVTADGILDLPDDFAGLVADPVYAYHASSETPRLAETSPERVMASWRTNNTAGAPTLWSLVPETFVPATGQDWKMYVAPIPAYDRDVKYRYIVRPAKLTDGAVFLLGGQQLSELYRVGSLADAEAITGHAEGIWEKRFAGTMAGAIDSDKTMFGTRAIPHTGGVDVGMG